MHESAEPGSGARSEPGTLAVELAEGFADDDVSVFVDGAPVWHGDRVTTNYSVGIADVVRLPLPSEGSSSERSTAEPTAPSTEPTPESTASSTAEVRVEVRVGRRSSSQRIDVADAAGEVRLRARIDPAGALTLGPASDEPRF